LTDKWDDKEIRKSLDPKRYTKKYFRHKIYDLSGYQSMSSWQDCRRMMKECNGFEGFFRKNADRCRDQFADPYRAYISTISSEIMAISFELCVFLKLACEWVKPKNILDLGSGFSSYVFNRYAQDSGYEVNVLSVDDDERWLEKTKEYLEGCGLRNPNLSDWNTFITAESKSPFDLILYDIGDFLLRVKYIEPILLKHSREGSIVVVDDMHHAGYGLHVRAVAEKRQWKHFNIRPLVKDHFGRYSWLIKC